jgi:acyl carrier protein
MPSTFDTVANIIAETCDIPRDTIKPESHSINDLGIDSLDFLDIAFAIDKAFGIKLPLEQWTQEVNDGKATTEQYFVLKNLCARIDDLVAARRVGGPPCGSDIYFVDRIEELNLEQGRIASGQCPAASLIRGSLPAIRCRRAAVEFMAQARAGSCSANSLRAHGVSGFGQKRRCAPSCS